MKKRSKKHNQGVRVEKIPTRDTWVEGNCYIEKNREMKKKIKIIKIS